MGAKTITKITLAFILTGFLGLSPLYGENTRGVQVEFNLIVDNSRAFSEIADNALAWVSQAIVNDMMMAGDRVTIWGAGEPAQIIFSGDINSNADRKNVKLALHGLCASAARADFLGALQQAASSPPFAGITYTLLVSSMPALASAIAGPAAGLLRISRVEEFPGWRAVVVGLNLDARVRQMAADLDDFF